MALSLDSKTGLIFVLHMKDSTVPTIKVGETTVSVGKSETDSNGLTYRLVKTGDQTYEIEILGIRAQNLDDTISVSGNAGGAFSVSASPFYYVKYVLETDGTSDHARQCVAALYEYYAAVADYLKP